MDDWNPLKEDFVDEQFNSYIRGPARGLVSRGPFTKGGQRHIKLYVTGIPEELQETGLINLFSRYGLVIRAKKVRSTRGTGDTYGFVTMANLTDAERAIRELDKFQIDRFMLRVKVALSEEERKKRKEQKKFEDSLLDMDNMDDSDSDENSEMPKTNGFGPPKEPVKARHTVGRGQYLKGVNTDGLLPTPGQPGSYPYQVGPSGDNTSRGPLFTSTPSPSSNLFIDTNSLNPVGSGYHSDIPSSGQYHHHTPKGRGSGTGTNRYEDNQLAGGFMSDHPQSSINYGLPMGRGAGLNYNQMAAGHNHGRRGGGRGRGWNNRFMGRGGRRGGGRGRGFQMAYPPPFYAPGMLYVDPYGIMAPAMAPHLLQPAYQAYQNPALMSQPPAPAKQQTTKEPEEKGLTQECSVCSTLGSHRCSRCKTPYCSAKCQSQDWPQHKGICKNIAREREQMEDFESRFDVSVGEDLIPQVKSLMESYIKEPIEITRKKDYKQLTKKSVNNDDANSTSSSSKRTAAEQETASSKIPSNSELQRTNQSETAGNESSKGKACFNCGSMDHMRNECPKPANFNLRCYNCNNVGHVSKDCPEKGMVCYNCQATGHLSRNCPGKGGQKKGGKGNKDSKRKSGSSPTSPSAQGSKMNQSGSRNKGQQQSLSDSPVNNVEKVCPAVRKSSSPVPPQSRVIAKIPPKKKLTAAGMKVGDQVEVVITMVVSPAEICVQIIHTENILALSNIMQAMAKKYPNSACDVASVMVGEFYAAQFSQDQKWYRAQVLSYHGNDIVIKFVDFGNQETTSIEQLRQLDSSMTSHPTQAVLCCLDNIQPVSGDAWPVPHEQLIALLTPDKVTYTAECCRVIESATFNSHVVRLTNTKGEDMGSKLIQAGLAARKTALADDGNQQRTGLPAAGPQLVRDVPLVISQLRVGEEIPALITDKSSPTSFTIQVPHIQSIQEFLEFNAKFNQICVNDKTSQYRPQQVGELVASLFSGDEGWYRGEVLQILDTAAAIKFLDYGNSETVPFISLRKAHPFCSSLPLQGVTCRLANINTPPCGWPEGTEQLLDVHCAGPVTGVIKEIQDTTALVELRTMSGELLSDVIKTFLQSRGSEMVKNYRHPSDEDGISSTESVKTDKSQRHSSSQCLESTKLPLDGTKISSLIVDVVSVDMFHIQQACEDLQIQLGGMMAKLNEVCSSAIPCDVKVGNYVAAQYSDGESTLWYRAQVVSKSTDKLTVFFVDYGNTDSVARDAVTQLDVQFMDVPAMAVCCSLVGSERVVSDSLAQLKQLMNVVVQVEAVKCEQGKHLVNLYHEGSLINSAICLPSQVQPVQTLSEVKPQAQQEVIAATELPLDNTKVSAVIMDVTSLDRFHIQEASEDAQTKLAGMMAKLNQACGSATPCDVEVGNYVAAQYSDGESTLWYRAQVVSKSTDKLTVFFVDYGNTDSVARDAVTQLDVQFMDVPAMAVCCSLVGSERIVNDSLAQFKQLMNVVVQVEAVKCERGKHLVNLYHEGSLMNSVICLPSQVQHFQTLSEVKPQAQQDDVINEETSLFSFTKSVKKTVLNKAIATTELPLDGTKVSAVLMDVTSLDNFHIQQASEDAQTKLASMMTNLNQACASATPCDVEVGNYVAAQYSDGESTLWYRAQVVSKSTDKLTVFFVDYGNTDSVARDAVTQLDAQFMAVPAMAVCCRLLGSERVVNDDGLAQLKQLMNVFVEVEAVKCEQDRFVVKIYQNQDLLNNTLCPEVTAVVVDETLPYVKSPSVPARSVNMINIQPTELIPDGSRVQSAPVFIESPSSFYIQLTNEEKKLSLAKMMQELNEHCIADSSHYEPVLGENVAAVFIENGQPTGWYRARVQDIKSNSEICVFFVDYGNTETLSVMGIRELPQSFFSLPAFGVHCRLLGGEMANEEAKSEMKVLINHELFTETVKREGDIHTVKLYLTDPNQTCVNTILNLDMFSKTCSEQLQVDVLQSKQEDQASSCTALVDSLPKPPITPPSDILPIRKSTSPIFVERKPVFVTTLHKNRPEKKEFKAIITSVVRPNLFHCQLFEDPAILQELKSLSDTMKVECETSQPTNLNLEQGELCCAYLPDDGKWYRGMVQEIFPDNTAKVWYVDFGNEADVPLNMLRPASEHYTQLPLQAFQCSLHGVIPVDGGWTAAARTKLSEFIRKPLMASVVEENRDTYSVEMVTTTGDNIGDILIEAGLAKPAQAHGLDEKDLLLKQKELLEQQVKMLEAKLAAAGHT